jgi:ligand-binding sensor domain-containing protein
MKMKKCILFLVSVLWMNVFLVRADSWSVYSSRFSFANNKLDLNLKLPDNAELVNAFPVKDGKILVILRNALPLTIDNQKQTISREYGKFFESLGYVSSPSSDFVKLPSGDIVLRNPVILARLDVAKNEWEGVNLQSRKAIGNMPLPDCDNLSGIALTNDGGLLLTGIKGKEPFIAVLRENLWQPIAIDPETLQKMKTPTGESQPNSTSVGGVTLFSGGERATDDGYVLMTPTVNKEGAVWFSSGVNRDKGIWRLYENQWTKISEDTVFDMRSNHYGQIVVSTKKGMKLIDSHSIAMTEILPYEASTILFDEADNFWFSPVKNSEIMLGSINLKYKTAVSFTKKNSPFNSGIIRIHEDENNNKYFITKDGLYVLNITVDMKKFPDWKIYSPGYLGDEEFAKYTHSDLYAVNDKSGLVLSAYDYINRWVGKYTNEQLDYKKFTPEKEAKSFLSSQTEVSCIAQSGEQIYVGTLNDGLLMYDFETGTAVKVAGYNDKTFGKKIHDLAVDKEGNLWIGSDDGLIKYDGNAFTLYNKKNSGFTTKTVHVLHYANNVLWIGTKDGLFTYDGSVWGQYGKKEGIKQDNIKCLTGYGNKIFAAGLDLFGVTKTLITIENGRLTMENTGNNFYDLVAAADDNTLWIGGPLTLRYKKGDEEIKLYPEEQIPFRLKAGIRLVDYCNKELRFLSHEDFSLGIKRTIGSQEKSPEELLAREYYKRLNTFDCSIVYTLKLK